MDILSIGSQYPFPLRGEGATANFLTQSGNTLQICIPNLTKEELFSLKKGKIKAGFLYKNGNMLWLFTFYDKKGQVLTLDSPFNIRLIPKDLLALHDITNNKQRLVVDIHVIDESNTLRALRSATMPPSLTVDFMGAVQEQMGALNSSIALEIWLQTAPSQLASNVDMRELGK